MPIVLLFSKYNEIVGLLCSMWPCTLWVKNTDLNHVFMWLSKSQRVSAPFGCSFRSALVGYIILLSKIRVPGKVAFIVPWKNLQKDNFCMVFCLNMQNVFYLKNLHIM